MGLTTTAFTTTSMNVGTQKPQAREKGKGTVSESGCRLKVTAENQTTPRKVPTKILDPAFLVPYQDRLRQLYGSLPHRISHFTAMSLAGPALKAGFELNVSGPLVDPEEAGRLRVLASIHRWFVGG